MKRFAIVFLALFGTFSLFSNLYASTQPNDNRWNFGIFASVGPATHSNPESVQLDWWRCITLHDDYFVIDNFQHIGKSSRQFHLSLSYIIIQKHEISVGLGSASYWIESNYTRKYPLRNNELENYQQMRNLIYFHGHLGYQYYFSKKRLFNPFMGFRISYEDGGNNPNHPAWGGQALAGIKTKSYKGFAFLTSVYWKNTYSKDFYRYDYKYARFSPQSYGIEIGLQYSF
jgi:hypothetical protein